MEMFLTVWKTFQPLEDFDDKLEYFIPWTNEEIISDMWGGHISVASFYWLFVFLPLHKVEVTYQ